MHAAPWLIYDREFEDSERDTDEGLCSLDNYICMSEWYANVKTVVWHHPHEKSIGPSFKVF